MGGTYQDFLSKARSQLGYHEGANNHTKYGDWYASVVKDRYFAYAPWCDEFMSWVGDQVGDRAVVGMFAATPSHARWFYNQGRWGHTPRPGAIVFYAWSGSLTISNIDHVGVVEAVNKNGTIVTIEGNSSNQVIRRVRNPHGIVVGYGYPRYPTSKPKPKPPAPKPVPTPTPKPGPVPTPTPKPVPAPKPAALKVDGVFGSATVKSLQHVLKVSASGSFNSSTKKALQKHLKVKEDGVIGKGTISALQRHVGAVPDGVWAAKTTRALQTSLNNGSF